MAENNKFLNKKRTNTAKRSEKKSNATKKKKISAVENVKNQYYSYTVDNNTWTGTYTGQWENDKPHGKGELHYQNDNDDNGRYTGQWENGKPDGTGKLYYKNGQPKYTGQWKNGKPHGKGIYYYNNGDRYEGDFVNSEFNGKGIYYHKDGDRYDGEFANGKFNGKGILYYKNGDRHEGDFKNSSLCKGTIKFANGIEAEIENYECVDIKRPLNIKDLELKHANGYAIDFRTDKKLNQFRKIGRYGEYKDIMADENFLKQNNTNIDVKKLIEEKIEQVCEDVKEQVNKGINQITLILDVHGDKKHFMFVKKQYVLSLLEKLSEILKNHENVKIYIENQACYAATKFSQQQEQDKYSSINDLEEAISSYFGESCDNRVFYTKSAVPDKTVRYDKTTDKHFAADENETKFDYYCLTGENLVKYDGEHNEAKRQKDADLHGNKVIDKTVNNNLENKDKDKTNSII